MIRDILKQVASCQAIEQAASAMASANAPTMKALASENVSVEKIVTLAATTFA
jgi:hypothetical protein